MAQRAIVRDASHLGRMLREGRESQGLTQRELAERLGITQRDVYSMESGSPTKYAHRLFQMMAALGLTMTVEVPDIPTDTADTAEAPRG
jgi:transcriptional regulator with XRE-family HTH domain